MDKKSGYEYAMENNYIVDRGNFYKLFKSIARLQNLTSAEKVIMSLILSYTDNGQEFSISNTKLAVEVGMGYASVIRVINSLREKGYIKTYKAYDRRRNMIVGRSVVPQKQFMMKEIAKAWDEYEYIEYGKDEENIDE